MILGMGNIGSYIVTADDGEVQVTEIPAETSEPETETSEEPVFSVSPESTPSPEAAGYAVTEMTPAPSESTQPSESPAWTAAPEPSAISTLIPETAAPEPSAESTVLPETAEPVSSPVATEAPASMPEMSFEQKEKTTGITVSVKAEAGTFPEGTTMELSPVEDQSILEDAKQASELQNPSAVAVDITFRDPDENIIEPQKQIRVTMTSDVIRQAESVDVVHVPDQAEDTSTAVVDQVPDQNLSEEEKPAEDQVVFDADQFSVYAIVYTVDFTFSGYTYSMEGGSSILLSSLASQLGLHDSEHDKDFDITEVAGVSFSDPSLVSIEKRDNDYMLTSLQPFTSDETLTIAMNDGSKYLVDVKDEQGDVDLRNYLTSIDTLNSNGDSTNGVVQDGDDVTFVLGYRFSSGALHKGQSITYQLNAEQSKYIKFSKDIKDCPVIQGITQTVGTVTVDSSTGKITIKLNDDFNQDRAFSGSLSFEGKVSSSGSKDDVHVDFGSSQTITIKPKPEESKYDLNVTKSGQYIKANNIIRYEVVISTNKGSGEAIQFSDQISASGIVTPKFEEGNVKVYKNGTSDSVQNVSLDCDNDGKLRIKDLPPLSSGESYHVIYEVPVNGDITSSDGGASISNECCAWNKYDTKWGKTTTVLHEPVIKKEGYRDSQTGNLKWKITINNPDCDDLGGVLLQDNLSVENGNISNIKYPLKFDILDANGVYVDEGEFSEEGKYTFPSGKFNGAKYTIVYETPAPTGEEGTTSVIKNNIIYQKPGEKQYESTSGNIGVEHPAHNYSLQKNFEGAQATETGTLEKLQWSATLDLPTKGINLENLTYTDTMTAWRGTTKLTERHYITPALLKDALIWTNKGTLKVGEDYRLFTPGDKEITNSTSTEKLSGFRVEFINSNYIDGQSEISLRYWTYADETDQQPGTTWTYKNDAEIPDHQSEAHYDRSKGEEGLTKQVSQVDGSGDDGSDQGYTSNDPTVEYKAGDVFLYYKISIHLNQDSSGPQTVTDYIPVGLEYAEFSNAKYTIYNSENSGTWKKLYNDENKKLSDLVSVRSETLSNGSTRVVFTIEEEYKLKNNYNKNYTVDLYYKVKVNDQNYWGDINHTEKSYTNEAVWGELKSDVTTNVKRTIKVLDKDGAFLPDSGGGLKKARYYLSINPQGKDLIPGAGNDTVTVHDKMSCDKTDVQMSFQPDSLHVYYYNVAYPNNCGEEMDSKRYSLTYDLNQNELFLTLPDETPCVVSYEYYIVPSTSQAELKNTASLSGVESSSTGKDLHLETQKVGASVSRREIDFYKVDSENYNIKLKGVTFKLFRYDGQENKSPIWTEVVPKVHSLITDADGKIHLSRDEDELSDGYLYKMIETDVGEDNQKAGYHFDNNKAYYFIWVKEEDEKKSDGNIWSEIKDNKSSGALSGDVRYIRNSGAFYVPNEKTSITINKVWLNSDNTTDNNHPNSINVGLYQSIRTGGAKITVQVIDMYHPERIFYNNAVYIDPGTPVSLQVETYGGASYKINDGNEIAYWDSNEHILSLGSPQKSAVYTVKVNTNSTPRIKVLYTPMQENETLQGTLYGKYVLNNDNNFSQTITGIPSVNGTGDPYFYYVVEEPVPEQYTASYINNNGIQKGTIVVTNTRISTQVTAKKKWKNADGTSTPPAGAFCEFELVRNGEHTGQTIRLDGTRDESGETSEWTATFSHLRQLDDQGKPYTYEVREVYSPMGYTPDNLKVSDGGTITNEQGAKSLLFTKIWSDGTTRLEWPSGKNIHVTLYRELLGADNNPLSQLGPEKVASYELSGVQVISKSNSLDSTKEAPECTVLNTGDYKIVGLPSTGTVNKDGNTYTGTWHYYVKEDNKVDGFKEPKYGTLNNGEYTTVDSMTYAGNGQAIINQKDSSYTLPSTGGHGTLPLTGAGALLLLLAGTVLTVRKLLIIRSAGEGGGSI